MPQVATAMGKANFLVLGVTNNPGLAKPTALARVARLLADRGVNIEAFASNPAGFRLLVSDTARAAASLRSAGFDPEVEECVELFVPNLPGELARVGERLDKAAVGIQDAFGVSSPTGARLFLRPDRPGAAAAALATVHAPPPIAPHRTA